jgi:hypothetical protein
MEIRNRIIKTELVNWKSMKLKTLATALEVDEKTIQNYAKAAKDLKLNLRETKGSYNTLEFVKYLHRMWKKAEKENQKNIFTKDENNKLLKIKIYERVISLREKARQLVSAEDAKIVFAHIKSSVNTNMDIFFEDTMNIVKADIGKEKEMTIRESYNELKKFLAAQSVKDKLVRIESILDDDFVFTEHKEADETKH